jgi:hypothetical protein
LSIAKTVEDILNSNPPAIVQAKTIVPSLIKPKLQGKVAPVPQPHTRLPLVGRASNQNHPSNVKLPVKLTAAGMP